MIAGVDGRLVSEQFLARLLAREQAPAGLPAFFAALHRWRDSQRYLGPASSLRSLLEAGASPLLAALGFAGFDDERELEGGRLAAATLRTIEAAAVLVVARYGEPLDPLWRTGIREAVLRGAEWTLLFNGTHLRLLQASRASSRRFTQFDLDAAADDEETARALWRIASTVSLADPNDARSTVRLIAASERHGAMVCRALQRGVRTASAQFGSALMQRADGASVDEVYPQALTLVYRLLFLFFAEARGLAPLWHPIYRDSYSVQHLGMLAADPRARGLWETVQAVSRLAQAGCRVGTLQVTAYNGRLFAPSRAPLVERPRLREDAAREALVALATQPATDGEGREPIAYRDLGVEQLGAVYETLLDYTPAVVEDTGAIREAAAIALRAGSNARKSSGSFYTPEPLVRYLLRRTLGPLVQGASPERILSLRVLDPSMGSGAFLVGACRYLAAAYADALAAAGRCHATDLGPAEHASIRRTIAERCLYGVDLNPMAVQLAQLSLWLATLAADRPLGFLDHHLVAGNSLLGTWLSALRHRPSPARPRRALPLFDDDPAAPALRDALPVRFSLGHDPSDTADQVRAKERALDRLTAEGSALSRWKRVADLWTAHWLDHDLPRTPALYQSLVDAIVSGGGVLPSHLADPLLARAAATARAHRAFHWEMEFPEVFFDEAGTRRLDGGFDAILGNPPWEMLRDDERTSADAVPGGAARLVRFARDAGVYEAHGDGHANCYQLFVERSVHLLRPGGRLGMVLPAGLLTDHGSAALRRQLFGRCRVESLAGFENRRAIFAIHRSVRFVLLSAEAGGSTDTVRVRLGETDVAALEHACDDHGSACLPWWPLLLTPQALERISGPSLAVPDLRSAIDVSIVERLAARFRPLGAPEGWAAQFGRELNATEDRGALIEGRKRSVAVVEGKQLEPFRTRIRDTRFSMSPADARARLGDRWTRSRLAYRDVASPTNRQTLIAAMLPAGVVSLHTVLCLKTRLSRRAQWYLCGLFNSFVVNYLVRLRVSTHVTAAIVERLPVPTESEAGPAFGTIAALARRLSQGAHADARSWLDARVARLFELTEEEFAHVVATFPLADAGEREAALREFRRW